MFYVYVMYITVCIGSKDNSVGLQAEQLGDWFRQGQEIFLYSIPQRPDRLWGPRNLPSKGYRRLFSLEQSGRGVKPTNHLHLIPRSRMWTYISIPPYIFMAWLINKYFICYWCKPISL
jgi:hypothetical protein